MSAVFEELAAERARQDAKWGPQNHPGVDPFVDYGIPTADVARTACETAAKQRSVTWGHILVEELAEALEAGSEAALRRELVQVAAVAVAWIECIDRRSAAGEGDLEHLVSWGPVMPREAST